MRLKALKIIFTVTLFWGFSVGAPIGNATSQGLYSSEDYVTILTSDNFKQELYGHNRSVLLEFYSSWCGYCQRFAPFWKDFARDIKDWQDLVTIAVMDCTNELNAPICSEFAVTRYPTLRYFHPNYQEGVDRYGLDIKSSLDPVAELKTLASRLVQEQTEGRGSIFPNLQPFISVDISQIFEGSSEATKYGILVLQDAYEYIGAQLTMDFHKVEEITVTYAYLNNTGLIKALHQPIDNLLILINRGDNAIEILSSGALDRVIFRDLINRAMLRKNIKIDNNNDIYLNKTMNNIISPSQNTEIGQADDTVYQVDLESALRYSLKREIGGLKEIEIEHKEPVQKYLTALLNYFPFGKNGKKLLTDILDYASNTNTPHGTTIRKMVMAADKAGQNVFSSSQGWIRCKGSAPEYRGYPCSMWTLFHYLTVNAAIDNEGKSNFDNGVLEAMYHYIKNFFGCRDCSEHFVARAGDKGLFNVTSYDDAVLWLWKVHNNVNKDLSGDPTEDPQHPKIQFPSTINCPQCHNGDGSWNEDEVLNYLKKIYSRRHISYTGANKDVLDIPPEYLKAAASIRLSGNGLILILIATLPLLWQKVFIN